MHQHPQPTHYSSPSFKMHVVVSQVFITLISIHCADYLIIHTSTAIIAAYYIGTSLFPEAKTYRFLADVLNDTAITLDALSPLLNSISLPSHIPLPPPGSIRVIALCLSGSFRSLCAIAAGGAKSALASHFASPPTGVCDLGDLNAKDSSRETVISLTGMLVSQTIWIIIIYLSNKLKN